MIVVVPSNARNGPNSLETPKCWSSSETRWTLSPLRCSLTWKAASCPSSRQAAPPELLAPYQADLEAIYDEIARLREGRPLILRATDIYNPLLSRWREKGIEDACRVCLESVNAAARQAAEEHRVPFVSVYDGFNGPDHDQDPRAKGLIRDDGEHPSEAGAQFIAELLQQSGYAYAGN